MKQKKFIFWIEIQGKIWYTKHSMDFYVMNTQMQLHKNGMNILSIIIRFPELIRTLTLRGVDVLFVAAQWPLLRKGHWQVLNRVRAIENQCFVVAVNGCGMAGETKYAGYSAAIDPWGETITGAGESEEILAAELDLDMIRGIRESINIYRDRRPGIYHLGV